MSTDEDELGRRQLEFYMNHSGLTIDELWLRQISIGGDADALEVEAYVLGLLRLDPYQHDIIAQALNEHFLDQGQDHPVPYSHVWDNRGRFPDV